MNENIFVFNPTVPRLDGSQHLRHALDKLTGKVVGFIDNGKPNFNYLVDDIAELLVSKYGVATVIKRRKRGPSVPAPDMMIKELSGQCDAVITGSGD
ncbi:MAG: hypothetical protein HY525_15005 [Betaproteobacteria bacterium]|nr:hypothetical protein [Betaproteobacteria bacterium]